MRTNLAEPPPPAKLGRVERAIAATYESGQPIAHGVPRGNRVGHRGRVRVPVPSALRACTGDAAHGRGPSQQPLDRSIDAVIRGGRRRAGHRDGGWGGVDPLRWGRGRHPEFMAEMSMVLHVTDGGAIHLTVDGVDHGIPGDARTTVEGHVQLRHERGRRHHRRGCESRDRRRRDRIAPRPDREHQRSMDVRAPRRGSGSTSFFHQVVGDNLSAGRGRSSGSPLRSLRRGSGDRRARPDERTISRETRSLGLLGATMVRHPEIEESAPSQVRTDSDGATCL